MMFKCLLNLKLRHRDHALHGPTMKCTFVSIPYLRRMARAKLIFFSCFLKSFQPAIIPTQPEQVDRKLSIEPRRKNCQNYREHPQRALRGRRKFHRQFLPDPQDEYRSLLDHSGRRILLVKLAEQLVKLRMPFAQWDRPIEETFGRDGKELSFIDGAIGIQEGGFS